MSNLDLIMNLEEYFSVEDYSHVNMMDSAIKTKVGIVNAFPSKVSNSTAIGLSTIRVNFMIKDKIKEIPLEKPYLKRICDFIKIYSSNDHFIRIIAFREENDYYNENGKKKLLDKMNSIKNFRGAILINLKINEFPLKNYILQNRGKNPEDYDFDQVFFLKKINNEFSNDNLNMQTKDVQDAFNEKSIYKLMNNDEMIKKNNNHLEHVNKNMIDDKIKGMNQVNNKNMEKLNNVNNNNRIPINNYKNGNKIDNMNNIQGNNSNKNQMNMNQNNMNQMNNMNQIDNMNQINNANQINYNNMKQMNNKMNNMNQMNNQMNNNNQINNNMNQMNNQMINNNQINNNMNQMNNQMNNNNQINNNMNQINNQMINNNQINNNMDQINNQMNNNNQINNNMNQINNQMNNNMNPMKIIMKITTKIITKIIMKITKIMKTTKTMKTMKIMKIMKIIITKRIIKMKIKVLQKDYQLMRIYY